jgi:hypothetical protein
MYRVCRVITGVFLFVYLAALALLVIGTFGLFGQERDPLSGVFLMPLGLPWNLMLDVFPEPLWPWLAAAAPALNLTILRFICGALASSK